MSAKSQLLLILGAIGILIVGILVTPNPKFTTGDIIAGADTVESTNIISDPTFKLGSSSAWKVTGSNSDYKIEPESATGATIVSTEGSVILSQTLNIGNLQSIGALSITADMQNLTGDGPIPLSLISTENIELFIQNLNTSLPTTSRFSPGVQNMPQSLVVSITLPGNSKVRLTNLSIIRLFEPSRG